MEERKNCGGGGEEDNFPVGMRVLAVDDDPICLKVLENLLRKCQYHVNTTNQAIIALQMLRENKNNYDLVISDVNMPDMDGFKLLECVNFEMDLPVIMLSAHSDKELVYKGVTHGAVDYLLKPVRLEELRNIWQHVIRKKKCLLKSQKRSQNQDRVDAEDSIGETQQGDASPVDVWGKVKCKRKDQDEGADEEEEEEGGNEDGNENDESSPQKKPRVVWSVDLHRKFVAAVDQLGLDKAVPKKILDLMNVEGLTRENVASHLQKYRLFLKRISTETSQQTNMVAGFGSMESSYLHTGSPTGYGDFRTLTGPGRLSSTSLTSYSPGRMLGRLSSPSRLTIRGISSPGLLQPVNSPILSNNTTILGKNLPSGHVSPYHGSPSFEANQSVGKSPCQYGDLSGSDYSMRFTFAATNPLTRPANLQQNQNLESLLDHPPATMPSLHQDSLDAAISGPFLDYSSMNENQKRLSSTQIPKFQATSWSLVDPSAPDSLPPRYAVPSMSSSKSPTINIPADFSCSNDLMDHLGNTSLDRRQPFLFGDAWENNSKDYSSNASSTFITMNSLVPRNSAVSTFSQSTEQGKIFDGSMINLPNNGPPSTFQQPVEKSALLQNTRKNDEFALEQSKSQACYVHNNYDSLADIMNPTTKQDENETTLDGEFGFNAYIS